MGEAGVIIGLHVLMGIRTLLESVEERCRSLGVLSAVRQLGVTVIIYWEQTVLQRQHLLKL